MLNPTFLVERGPNLKSAPFQRIRQARCRVTAFGDRLNIFAETRQQFDPDNRLERLISVISSLDRVGAARQRASVGECGLLRGGGLEIQRSDVERTQRTGALDASIGRKVRGGRTAGTGGIADVQAGGCRRSDRPIQTNTQVWEVLTFIMAAG
jgi:hypothetical protein